jgi:hypothetical protein
MTTHYADAVFAILPHLESTKALYDIIKRSAVEAGRSLFRVQPGAELQRRGRFGFAQRDHLGQDS